MAATPVGKSASWTVANALGFMSDSLHGSPTGYPEWANSITAVLRNA